MKQTSILFVAGIAALACSAGDPEFKIASTTTLKDGSVVRADFLSDGVNGSTAFLKDLSLKPEIIDSLTFKGTNGEARVTLTNKDNFALSVVDKSYKIESSLGTLDVPAKNIRSITFRKVSTATGSQDGLIFYCTFDNPEDVANPAIGPSAHYNRATLSEGKEGQALLAQRFKPQVAYDLPANFFGKSGCIEFWAKILKTSPYVGSGGDPRLFTLVTKETGDTVSTIDIVSNNGNGNSGFATWTICGNIASIGGMRGLNYSELFDKGDWRDWHHYAVVWDADGIKGLPFDDTKKAALFVDGKITSCAQFDTRKMDDINRLLASPSRLCFTHDPDKDPEHQTKSPFLIDEFKIWNFAKTDFD